MADSLGLEPSSTDVNSVPARPVHCYLLCKVVPQVGLEPTRREAPDSKSGMCYHFITAALNLAEPTELESATSCLTGKRSNQLSYGSI